MKYRWTTKNSIFIGLLIALVVFFPWIESWLKTNAPALVPYSPVIFGIAIGIGAVFQAAPAQSQEKMSGREKVLTFLGCVVFTFLFFTVADWINASYPNYFVAFRIACLGLMALGWRKLGY